MEAPCKGTEQAWNAMKWNQWGNAWFQNSGKLHRALMQWCMQSIFQPWNGGWTFTFMVLCFLTGDPYPSHSHQKGFHFSASDDLAFLYLVSALSRSLDNCQPLASFGGPSTPVGPTAAVCLRTPFQSISLRPDNPSSWVTTQISHNASGVVSLGHCGKLKRTLESSTWHCLEHCCSKEMGLFPGHFPRGFLKPGVSSP